MPIYREWPNQDGVYCECVNKGNRQVTVGTMKGLGEDWTGAMGNSLMIYGLLLMGGLFIWGMKK